MEHLERCVVIGYGHMGKKVGEVLRQLSFEKILVDPDLKAGFKDETVVKAYTRIDDLLLVDEAKDIKAWFICTPTANHFETLNKLVRAFPKAKVMIEKPPCTRNQINELFHLSQMLNLKNVWINNHYADCKNLKDATDFIKKSNSYCRKIVIDFCKNRSIDVATGRYVDKDFLIWGYEGFHMLHIATQLMSDKEAKDFIHMQGKFRYFKGNNSQISWVAEYGKLESGLVILLRATTDGSIFFPSFRKGILNKQQRLRRVNAFLENGINLFLVFGESRERELEADQNYYFGWQSPDRKLEYWQNDSPLKIHIKRFLEQENTLATSTTFNHGLKLTQRLSCMTDRTYSDSNTIKLP